MLSEEFAWSPCDGVSHWETSALCGSLLQQLLYRSRLAKGVRDLRVRFQRTLLERLGSTTRIGDYICYPSLIHAIAETQGTPKVELIEESPSNPLISGDRGGFISGGFLV
jgi:hypothetical protein